MSARPVDPAPSLTARVLGSLAWLTALAATGRVVALIRILVLARLLVPRDFGLVAIAVVSLSLLDALTVTATHLSLIRQKEHRSLLDAAWTIGLLRGIGIGSLLFAAAGPIGSWVAEPGVVPLIRAMAALPVISGLRNIATVEFQKDLRFGPHYRLETAAVLADLLVAVPLAVVFQSAWALVAGYYALTLTRVVASYLLHPYRPRLRWTPEGFRQLLRLTPATIVLTLVEWALGDGMIAATGMLLGVETLGVFLVAWRIVGQPVTELARVVGTAMIPTYAGLAEEPERARAALSKGLGLVAVLGSAVVVPLALAASFLVDLVLTERWAEVVPVLRVLLAFAWVRGFHAVAAPVQLGLGTPRRQSWIAFGELAVLASTLPFAIESWGVVGVAIATLARGAVGAASTLVAACIALRLALTGLWPVGLASALTLGTVALCSLVLGRADTMGDVAALAVAGLSGLVLGVVALRMLGWPLPSAREMSGRGSATHA